MTAGGNSAPTSVVEEGRPVQPAADGGVYSKRRRQYNRYPSSITCSEDVGWWDVSLTDAREAEAEGKNWKRPISQDGIQRVVMKKQGCQR